METYHLYISLGNAIYQLSSQEQRIPISPAYSCELFLKDACGLTRTHQEHRGRLIRRILNAHVRKTYFCAMYANALEHFIPAERLAPVPYEDIAKDQQWSRMVHVLATGGERGAKENIIYLAHPVMDHDH